jgi:hypothetical protein
LSVREIYNGDHEFSAWPRVLIEFEGQAILGQIALVSKNGRALLLTFEAVLGRYVGSMSVLADPARRAAELEYRDLRRRQLVQIRHRE